MGTPKTRIGQLLAALGSGPQVQNIGLGNPSTPALDQAPPATLYDWRDPHYFNAAQKDRLAQALGQTAARLAEIFTRSRGKACEVTLQGLTQHFAGDLCGRLDRDPKHDRSRLGTQLDHGYCVTFAPEKGQACGFASISAPTAATWVTWLLGDADSARDPSQALSSLEESLLDDLLTAVLNAFLAPLRAFHNLLPAGRLCQGQPTIQFDLTEEVCQIVFRIKSADAGKPAEITFMLPCRRLDALAGKVAATPAKVTPQELSRALREHVQEVPMTVRATLASTALTFQEILDLVPGDILLLGKPVAGLTELALDGRALFRGRPAQSQGRYAVVITERTQASQ